MNDCCMPMSGACMQAKLQEDTLRKQEESVAKQEAMRRSEIDVFVSLTV